jgi:hypothetical protein
MNKKITKKIINCTKHFTVLCFISYSYLILVIVLADDVTINFSSDRIDGASTLHKSLGNEI